MYNIICETNRQSRFDTGCLGLVHWDDPEGWYREGGGRGFRMGNTCTPVADSCRCVAESIQYCKVISLQFKLKKFNKSDRLEENIYNVYTKLRLTFITIKSTSAI